MPEILNDQKPDKVDEKIRTSGLLDLYGGLLSKRQERILRLYTDEDLGFSEIAEELKITRQAVFDATRQAQSSLEKFEKHLGLLAAGSSSPVASPDVGEKPTGAEIDGKEVRKLVESLEKMASEDIIYDTGKLRKKIQGLKELLRPGG